jgi:putative membrane protein
MIPTSLPLLDGPTSVGVPGWHVHLEAIFPLVIIEGLYLLALVKMHGRDPKSRPLAERSIVLFTIGIMVIYLAIGTPLDDLADHYWVSAHMLQHVLIGVIAPAFLLMGTPGWMLRPFLTRPGVFPIAYVLTRPLVAFALFNLVVVFVHLPSMMTLEIQHEYTIHLGVHILLIGTGLLAWWPVLAPVPELPGLSSGLQLVYLFVQGFAPAVLTAFLIFGTGPIYPIYTTMPRLLGLSVVDDQRIGGLIMKLGGTAIYWIAGTIIFFQWFAREERDEPPTPPPLTLEWPEVEEELARMGLTSPPDKSRR